jgi:HPr kinase/phosphorylase
MIRAGDAMGETNETQVHGALIDVLGVGVLLLGASGVGKSECALELVSRGHRLVSDDIVRIRRKLEPAEPAETGEPRHRLVGSAPELIRHYMEIRGIGLLYVPDLYGPDSVLKEAPMDLVCRLEPWSEDNEYERVGLERPTWELLGVVLPCLLLPVHPARSMATLVEVAVRDHQQRCTGVNAAARLDARLRAEYGRLR